MAGLLCEEEVLEVDNVKYCGYCKYHFSKMVSPICQCMSGLVTEGLEGRALDQACACVGGSRSPALSLRSSPSDGEQIAAWGV
jgi:hypothetical protein